MTWRELDRLAAGRQRAEWGRAHAVAFWVCRSMCGQGPTLKEFVPAGLFPPPPKPRELTPEDEARQMEFSGKLMEMAWQAVYGGG